ncbi:GrpB family protein [Nocardia sp. NPDC060256]|uniref:GrpB family protein n=1 Tax=unclassified Nocardia TaxID=2637762 RepID=UPI003656C512
MPDRTELIGGVEKRDIRIVDYDPTWPERFADERARIATALGVTARRIDHIGSTSIPGLAAKPIIDIDVSVPDIEDENTYLEPLLAAGYQLRVREPGHRMVRTPKRDVHVHLSTVASDWERRHLLFRDWLRHDAHDRAAYGQLKQQLVQRDWPDMNAYADAKGPLIIEITARAETWAQSIGWMPGD